MAIVTIPAEARRITDPAEIKTFLHAHGLRFEVWPLEDRVDPAADSETILAAYATEIDALKARGGFVTADVIDVRPETPGLDTMLDRFNKEHTHTEDEVRFTLQGRGRVSPQPRRLASLRDRGPRGRPDQRPPGHPPLVRLCGDRRIRAIRLFQDQTGWTPHYIADGVHSGYEPLCLGPAWVAGQQ